MKFLVMDSRPVNPSGSTRRAVDGARCNSGVRAEHQQVVLEMEPLPPRFFSRTPYSLCLLPFRGDDTFHLRISKIKWLRFSASRNPPPLTTPLPLEVV